MVGKWDRFEQTSGQSTPVRTPANATLTSGAKPSSQAIPIVNDTLKSVDELKSTIARVKNSKATVMPRPDAVTGGGMFSGDSGADDPLGIALSKLDGTIQTGREVLANLGVAPAAGLTAAAQASATIEAGSAISPGLGSRSADDEKL